MGRLSTAAAAGLVTGSVNLASGPVRAEGDGITAAGLSGFVPGVASPFVNGYDYHPSGDRYVRDPRYLCYPVANYIW